MQKKRIKVSISQYYFILEIVFIMETSTNEMLEIIFDVKLEWINMTHSVINRYDSNDLENITTGTTSEVMFRYRPTVS